MQDVMNRKSWVRSGVALHPTTVVADSGGLGAFAPTHEYTLRGSFLGVYRAPSWRRASPDSKYRGKSDYVMQVGLWRAAPRSCDKTPNLADFKMMAVQEPPPGTEANCQFVYFSQAGQINAPLPKSRGVSLVALYATRDLEPGEELFALYGKDKARNYKVGLPGAALHKYEIPCSEYPGQWLVDATAARLMAIAFRCERVR